MSATPRVQTDNGEVEALAAELHASGFLVTRASEVEPAAIASLLGVSCTMLRRWRSELVGPPARKHGRRFVLYPLAGFLQWRRDVRSRR